MARDCYQFPKYAEIVHIERGGLLLLRSPSIVERMRRKRPREVGQTSLRKSLQNPV